MYIKFFTSKNELLFFCKSVVCHNIAPPRLMKKQDEVVSENGKNSKVTCILDKANPLPTFKWEYQNMNCPDFDTSKCQPVESHWMPVPESVIMTPKRSPANESIIRVQSDQPAARYRCKAFNKLGSDSHVIKFFRHGKNSSLLKNINSAWM